MKLLALKMAVLFSTIEDFLRWAEPAGQSGHKLLISSCPQIASLATACGSGPWTSGSDEFYAVRPPQVVP